MGNRYFGIFLLVCIITIVFGVTVMNRSLENQGSLKAGPVAPPQTVAISEP